MKTATPRPGEVPWPDSPTSVQLVGRFARGLVPFGFPEVGWELADPRIVGPPSTTREMVALPSMSYNAHMQAIHMSTGSVEEMVEHRRRTGAGRLDECWEGVWHLTDPNRRHQHVAGLIYAVHLEALGKSGRGEVLISVNVTDREADWRKNHRCPDGAIILSDNTGRWVGENETAFLGGPDLVVEVLSKDDDTYTKFDFYKALKVREILVVDPETRRLELWRLEEGEYEEMAQPVKSDVTGLLYTKESGDLTVKDPTTGKAWKV